MSHYLNKARVAAPAPSVAVEKPAEVASRIAAHIRGNAPSHRVLKPPVG